MQPGHSGSDSRTRYRRRSADIDFHTGGRDLHRGAAEEARDSVGTVAATLPEAAAYSSYALSSVRASDSFPICIWLYSIYALCCSWSRNSRCWECRDI